MSLKLRCLLLISMITVLSSCRVGAGKFYVDNKSSEPIDSVVIYFMVDSVKMTSIPPNSLMDQTISKKYLQSGHDLKANACVYSKGRKFETPLWFTDLGASYNEIGVIIDKSLNAKIVLE